MSAFGSPARLAVNIVRCTVSLLWVMIHGVSVGILTYCTVSMCVAFGPGAAFGRAPPRLSRGWPWFSLASCPIDPLDAPADRDCLRHVPEWWINSTTVVRVSLPASVFFFQAEDGIRDLIVTGVQTCALPI